MTSEANETCHLLAVAGTAGNEIAIILLVTAEMLSTEHGIGTYILQAGSLYDHEWLFVWVVILSLLGVLVSAAIGLIKNRLLSLRV